MESGGINCFELHFLLGRIMGISPHMHNLLVRLKSTVSVMLWGVVISLMWSILACFIFVVIKLAIT